MSQIRYINVLTTKLSVYDILQIPVIHCVLHIEFHWSYRGSWSFDVFWWPAQLTALCHVRLGVPHIADVHVRVPKDVQWSANGLDLPDLQYGKSLEELQ